MTNDRFRNHADSALLVGHPGAQAVAANYDFLADQGEADLAMAYLVRTVATPKSGPINNTGLVTLLGNSPHVVNEYGVGGSADVPTFTVDPDGVTLRVGRPRPNWISRLISDPRPRFTLPAVDLTKKK
jgi:hypothetical protein